MSNSEAMMFGSVGIIFWLVYVVVCVVMIVGEWRMFAKADEPGWACLVPFYNIVVMCRIGGLSPWLVLLMFVPIANVVVAIMIYYKFFRGYFGEGLSILALFLPIIMIPYAGFSNEIEYQATF